MAIWDEVISEEDKEIHRRAGYGRIGGLGKRPALAIVDMSYMFLGDKPEPIAESQRRFPLSCGARGWEAVGKIQELLALARRVKIPVFYSTGFTEPGTVSKGRWAAKNANLGFKGQDEVELANEILTEIAPIEGEIVIRKAKPSIFFGTPFMSYLTERGVDSLIFCGTTTSSCVRASVVDAFSHNLAVAVVEECTFDSIEISHKVGLFDIHSKFADVMKLQDVKSYLENLCR